MAYKKEEIKAGFVVMIALLIFSAMVIFIGGSKFWEKLDIYHARFAAIGGLEKGASVRLGGFRVGQVLDIAVASDDVSQIDVTIGVKPDTPIRREIIASVHTLGLVGDYYVLLIQKSGVSDPLPPGSLIASREMVEIGDLLVHAADLSQTLNSSIEDVMGAVSRILSEENIMSVQEALHGVNRLTVQGEKSLATITDDLNMVLTRIDVMVTNLDSIVLENRENAKHTLLALRESAEKLNDLVLTMNQTLVENRKDLRSTVVAIRDDSHKAGHLIDNLNGRVSVTGDYLEETMANLMEISEDLRLLSSQLKRQPWRLIYRERVRR